MAEPIRCDTNLCVRMTVDDDGTVHLSDDHGGEVRYTAEEWAAFMATLRPDWANDVTLPWQRGDLDIRRVVHSDGLVAMRIRLEDGWVRMSAGRARSAAAALWAAAQEVPDDRA